MDDLISRQAVIDAFMEIGGCTWEELKILRPQLKVIEQVPSAESQWISVSERLPEDDTEVVVSCTDDSGDSEFSYTTTG